MNETPIAVIYYKMPNLHVFKNKMCYGALINTSALVLGWDLFVM
jgi:hypothetical protein